MKKFLPLIMVLLTLTAFADTVPYTIKIVDQKTRMPLADAYVRAIDLTEGRSIVGVSNDSGYVALLLKPDNKYRIDITRKTTETGTKYITVSYFVSGVEILKPSFHEISMEKVKVNSVVSLQNLYFDRNRVELNSNDKMALANTLIALRNSPTLTIEIAVRADCNETEEVAAKRAEVIKQYFADKSDYANRITVKNYGKAKQLAGCNCDSPMVYPDEVYTMNRVAEFRILNF
jgi:outer membrane protein OmpA-like peptidoglycan-associated protein